MRKFALALLFVLPFSCFAITAKSYIITDLNGVVIAEKNADVVRPIASITKLVTAQRSAQKPSDDLITITAADWKAGQTRRSTLKVGQTYTRDMLTRLALVSSDNVAAIALGRASSEIKIDLPPKTHIVEASGLDPDNVSTARELSQIARNMYGTALALQSVQKFVPTPRGLAKSTNPLIGQEGWAFHLSKTGWIHQAGGCVVAIVEIKDRPTVVVLLGATSVRQRWKDLYELRKRFDQSNFVSPK